MISLTPLIAHLTSKPADFDGLWFRQVAGAAEYAQIDLENLPKPSCWVIRAADKVSHAGERAEDVTLGFDVVIAIENARDHAPGETDDQLLQYRAAVKNLLLGWEIDPDTNPIVFNGGRVLEYERRHLFWADSYGFNALITNYLPDPPPYESLTNLRFTTGENP